MASVGSSLSKASSTVSRSMPSSRARRWSSSSRSGCSAARKAASSCSPLPATVATGVLGGSPWLRGRAGLAQCSTPSAATVAASMPPSAVGGTSIATPGLR